METAGKTPQDNTEVTMPGNRQEVLSLRQNGKPGWIEPDPDFVRRLASRAGKSFMMCMQCGTCSATCAVSPDIEPFPRKELAWARWGIKDLLLADSDIWLCYQCNDCSSKCPRGARPGEVLAAIRQECVINYATPRFFARWVSQPQSILILLGIPILLLTLALLLVSPLENALGITRDIGERIVFSYSSMFPHWMLNSFFGFFTVLVLIAIIRGIMRFWRAMKSMVPPERLADPAKKLYPSVLSALKDILMHKNFDQCTTAKSRYISHMCVLFGFAALSVVSLWVITAGINPLMQTDFVYPFGFWSLWKILANLGGAALVVGCILIIRERFKNNDLVGPGSYFDWALISILLLVAITGFITEILHYLRLEPHRHVAYFAHLVFAFTVLVYLPYSKLAHLAYRSAALVFAEHTGRNNGNNSGRKGADQHSTTGPDEENKNEPQ